MIGVPVKSSVPAERLLSRRASTETLDAMPVRFTVSDDADLPVSFFFCFATASFTETDLVPRFVASTAARFTLALAFEATFVAETVFLVLALGPFFEDACFAPGLALIFLDGGGAIPPLTAWWVQLMNV